MSWEKALVYNTGFFFSFREHPIGDKSFQTYIRQQSEISAHSIWSAKDSAEELISDAKQQNKREATHVAKCMDKCQAYKLWDLVNVFSFQETVIIVAMHFIHLVIDRW